MGYPHSDARVLKVNKGMPARVMIVSPAIHYFQHWIDGRSYLCPIEDCLACKAWVNISMVAALVFKSKGSPLQFLKSNAAYWRADLGSDAIGQVVDVQLESRSVSVNPEKRIEVSKPIDEMSCWAVLATMHRLPLPQNCACSDAMDEMHAAARNQIIAALPILARFADD